MDFRDLQANPELDPVDVEEYIRNTHLAQDLVSKAQADRRPVSAGYFGKKYVDRFMSGDPEQMGAANDDWMNEFGNDSVEIDVFDDFNGLYLFTCPSLIQVGDVGLARNRGVNLSEVIRKIEVEDGNFVYAKNKQINSAISSAANVVFTNSLRNLNRLFRQDIVVQYYGYPSFFTKEERQKLFPRYALERWKRVVRNNPGLSEEALTKLALEEPLILRSRTLGPKQPETSNEQVASSEESTSETVNNTVDESEFGW